MIGARRIATDSDRSGSAESWARVHASLAAADEARSAWLDAQCRARPWHDKRGRPRKLTLAAPLKPPREPSLFERATAVARRHGLSAQTVFWRATHGWPESEWHRPPHPGRSVPGAPPRRRRRPA